MEKTDTLSNRSSEETVAEKAAAVKYSLLRGIMLLFLFVVSSLASAMSVDYVTIGSIAELKAKCESGDIHNQDYVFIDCDFTVQQKYSTSRYFVNDDNDSPEFIVLANFRAKLYPDQNNQTQRRFHGLFGRINIDQQFALYAYSSDEPDELSKKVHQTIEGEPEFCLPVIADADFFTNKDNFGKVFRLDGNFKVSESVLTVDEKAITVLGKVENFSDEKILIGGFYDIYNGNPEVYITEVWNAGIEHTLKAVGGIGGTATIGTDADDMGSGPVEVKDGSSVWLKATPNSGFVFESWTVCGEVVSNEAECSVVAMSNSTYRANFRADGVPQKFEFAVTSNDVNLGTVEVEVSQNAVDGSQFEAEAGSTMTLTAMPIGNAGFDGWYANDEKLSDQTTYSFAASEGLAIEARFYQRYAVTIAANDLGKVAVTADGTPVAYGEFVADGATIVVTATPNPGMELESLTINGVERTSPFTMAAESDIAVVAKFADPTVVTVEEATSLADLRDNHPDGRKVRITTPLTVVMGYGQNWLLTDGNSVIPAELSSSLKAKAGMVLSELKGECKNYDEVGYLVKTEAVVAEGVEPASILPQAVSVDKLPEMGGQYVTISNASLTKEKFDDYIITDNSRIDGLYAKFLVTLYGESTVLTGFSNGLKDNQFFTVTGFVGSIGNGLFLFVTQLPEITGNTNNVKISVFVDDAEHGRSWMTVGEDAEELATADVVNGTEVTLHAEAAEGYEFAGWKLFGEDAGTDTPMTVEVTTPSTYTAIFSEKAPETPEEPVIPGGDDDDDDEGDDPNPAPTNYTLTLTQSAHGTLQAFCGTTEVEAGAAFAEGTEITIVATADDGYHLLQVLVDGNPMETTADGKLKITLTADATVTAVFERNMPAYASLSVAAAEWLEGEPMGTVYIDEPGTTSLTSTRGETHAFHAEPAEGCRFVGWRVQGGNAIQNISDVFNLVAAEDLMLVAEFDYIITTPRRVVVRPSRSDKGTVKIEGTGSTELTTRRYLHISAASSGPDHEFAGWTDGDGQAISTEASIVYSDASPAELIANFSSAYFVTLSADGQGTISCPSTDLSKRVAEGSTVRILIVPAENHELAEVTVDGVPTTAKESADGSYYVDLTVDAPHAVAASFALRKFTVMFSSHAHGELAVYTAAAADGRPAGDKLSSGLQTPYDTQLHVYITPDDDYKIETLTVNGAAMELDKLDRDGATVYFTLPVRSDVAIVATYVYDGHTTAVAMPAADAVSPDASVYDLNGRVRCRLAEFSSLPSGIYLVPSGSRGYKKIVKQ